MGFKELYLGYRRPKTDPGSTWTFLQAKHIQSPTGGYTYGGKSRGKSDYAANKYRGDLRNFVNDLQPDKTLRSVRDWPALNRGKEKTVLYWILRTIADMLNDDATWNAVYEKYKVNGGPGEEKASATKKSRGVKYAGQGGLKQTNRPRQAQAIASQAIAAAAKKLK